MGLRLGAEIIPNHGIESVINVQQLVFVRVVFVCVCVHLLLGARMPGMVRRRSKQVGHVTLIFEVPFSNLSADALTKISCFRRRSRSPARSPTNSTRTSSSDVATEPICATST